MTYLTAYEYVWKLQQGGVAQLQPISRIIPPRRPDQLRDRSSCFGSELAEPQLPSLLEKIGTPHNRS